MNVQAAKDWMKALPNEDGDHCVILLASKEDYAFMVDGTVGVVSAMLIKMGVRNPDFGVAVIMAAAKLADFAEEGGEE